MTIIDFDKKEMMEDENGFYLRQMAKEVPMTFNSIDKLISFICGYVHTQNKVIKKCEAEGKDTTHMVYERDRALYALGLSRHPEPYWKK